MNCDRTRLMQAYHDGELSAAQADALQAHLVDCAACRAELASLQHLSRLLAAAPLVEPSQMAMQRWLQAARGAQERAIRRLAGWLTAAAAAIVLVATVTRPVSPPPTLPTAGVDLLALDGSGEALPETLVAARWMALDLGAVARVGVEQ
jgi:anti-sigma factor RsiW